MRLVKGKKVKIKSGSQANAVIWGREVEIKALSAKQNLIWVDCDGFIIELKPNEVEDIEG